MQLENVKNFFSVYPEGKLIHILRAPCRWYSSAMNHDIGGFAESDTAIRIWIESADSMLVNHEHFGNRVEILQFNDLVCKTELLMKRLALSLGISFENFLLMPTFNKQPIKADSSYPVQCYGIIRDSTERCKEILTMRVIDKICGLTNSVYSRVMK